MGGSGWCRGSRFEESSFQLLKISCARESRPFKDPSLPPLPVSRGFNAIQWRGGGCYHQKYGNRSNGKIARLIKYNFNVSTGWNLPPPPPLPYSPFERSNAKYIISICMQINACILIISTRRLLPRRATAICTPFPPSSFIFFPVPLYAHPRSPLNSLSVFPVLSAPPLFSLSLSLSLAVRLINVN